MAMLTKAGTFDAAIAIGNQAITGIGFQPKAVIIWGVGPATDGAFYTGGFIQGLGFSTSPTNQYAQSSIALSTISTGTYRRLETCAFIQTNTSTAIIRRANLASMDIDGFTLNWTVARTDAAFDVLHYLAIGGDDLTGAAVVNWQMPTVTGNKSVIGVGFQPDCVLHLHAGGVTALDVNATQIAALGLGVMTSGGEQWATGYVTNSSTAHSRNQESDKTLTAINTAGGIVGQASYASMDSDGFTTNFGVAAGGLWQVISLCLQGGQYDAQRVVKSTAAAAVSQSVAGVGFTPQGILLAGVQDIVRTAPLTGSGVAYGLGASDGTTEWGSDLYGAATATRKSTSKTTKAYAKINAASAVVDAEADMTGFDSDGFALNLTTNDAVATSILYLAFGNTLRVATRTVPQDASISTLVPDIVRTVPQTAAIRTTATDTVPETAAIRVTLIDTVPQTASIQPPATVQSTVPETASIRVTLTDTIPFTSAIRVASTDTVPKTAAIETTLVDTIPQSSAIRTTSTDTVPQSSAISTTATDTVPQTVAVRVTATDTVPQSAAIETTSMDTVPETASIRVTSSDTVPETAAIRVLDQSGTIPQTMAIRVLDQSGPIGQSAVIRTTATDTIPQSASIITTSTDMVSQDVAIRTTSNPVQQTTNYISNPAPGNLFTNSHAWDIALNGTTSATAWGDYNSGVADPSVGYHAHIESTAGSEGGPAIVYIDRNGQFGQLHRWLGSSHSIPTSALALQAGDSLTLSMSIKVSDLGKPVNVGFYHTTISTGLSTFLPHGTANLFATAVDEWQRVSRTITVDDDWDTTIPLRIYLYGHAGAEADLWVERIQVELGPFATPYAEGGQLGVVWTGAPEASTSFRAGNGFIPQTASILTMATDTVPQSAVVEVTATDTVPQSAAIAYAFSRTVGQDAVVSVLAQSRLVGQSAVIASTFARTTSQSAAISVLGLERAIGASAALLTMQERSITQDAVVADVASQSRIMLQTVAVSASGLTRTVLESGAIRVTATDTVPVTVAIQTTLVRTAPGSVAIRTSPSRTVPASASIGDVIGVERTISQAAAIGVVGLGRSAGLTAAVLVSGQRSIPQAAATRTTASRTVPVTAIIALAQTRTIPSTVASMVRVSRTVSQSAAIRTTPSRSVELTAVIQAEVFMPWPDAVGLSVVAEPVFLVRGVPDPAWFIAPAIEVSALAGEVLAGPAISVTEPGTLSTVIMEVFDGPVTVVTAIVTPKE